MTASHWQKKKNAGVPLKERDANDHYPTPPSHVKLALSAYASLSPLWVLDIGAGAGVWGEEARALWPETQIIGSEIRYNVPKHPAYDRLIHGDFLSLPSSYRASFDVIMANPPYKLSEAIIRKGFDLLLEGAVMVMLFRLQFLASVRRNAFYTREFPPTDVWVCSDRPSFSGDGNTDSDDYCLIHWRKGYRGKTLIDWKIADEVKREKAAPKQKPLF